MLNPFFSGFDGSSPLTKHSCPWGVHLQSSCFSGCFSLRPGIGDMGGIRIESVYCTILINSYPLVTCDPHLQIRDFILTPPGPQLNRHFSQLHFFKYLNRELEPKRHAAFRLCKKQHAAFFTTFVCTSNSHTLMLLHLVNALWRKKRKKQHAAFCTT
jgi:hypothetical protein